MNEWQYNQPTEEMIFGPLELFNKVVQKKQIVSLAILVADIQLSVGLCKLQGSAFAIRKALCIF
jgi:hypothetical protein